MMAVMNNGKFVEFGPSEAIYENPKEAYTERLIDAIRGTASPRLTSAKRSAAAQIEE